MSFQDGTIDLSREIAGVSSGSMVPPPEDFPTLVLQGDTRSSYSGTAVRLTFVARRLGQATGNELITQILGPLEKDLQVEDPEIFLLTFEVRRKVAPRFHNDYRFDVLYADPASDFPGLAAIILILALILGIVGFSWAIIAGPEALEEAFEGISEIVLGAGGILILGLILVAGVRRRRN